MGINYIDTLKSFAHWYLLLASSNSMSMVRSAGVKLFFGFKITLYCELFIYFHLINFWKKPVFSHVKTGMHCILCIGGQKVASIL